MSHKQHERARYCILGKYLSNTWNTIRDAMTTTTTTTTTTANFIEIKYITILPLLSHPQIGYELIKAGAAKDISYIYMKDLSIDGLNNSKAL